MANWNNLIYKKRFYDSDQWEEITYEKALDTVLTTYKDNEEVRSMLTIGNYIPCRFSEIRVYEVRDGLLMTSMAGLQCLIP